ncbi:hypothetical protein FQZ97_1179770 [compost metagenome]
MGRGADAEGRHQVIEKAVVVVRGEEDHQLGIEAGDARTSARNHLVDLAQDRRRRIDMPDQRAVRLAVQVGTHFTAPASTRLEAKTVACPSNRRAAPSINFMV